MIQNPTFKPTEIRKESGVIVDELNDIEDNPEELIFDKFEEVIYSGNSLSLPIIGTEKNIRTFTQNDLFNYVKEKYGFNKMIVAASGAVEHDKVIKLVDKYFLKDLGVSCIKRRYYNHTNIPAKV